MILKNKVFKFVFESIFMNNLMLPFLIIILLSLIGVLGDFFIKLSGSGVKFIEYKWFIIGLLIYASTSFGWFFVMKYVKLSVLGVLYSISTALFLLILGVLFFKEKLNFYEYAGVLTAIISLILLGISS